MSYPRLGAYAIEPDAALVAAALDWPITYVSRETSPNHARGGGVMQAHLICARCEQSVICLSPDTARTAYLIKEGDIAVQVIAHMQQRHAEFVPAT
jgi:hypothetical protein